MRGEGAVDDAILVEERFPVLMRTVVPFRSRLLSSLYRLHSVSFIPPILTLPLLGFLSFTPSPLPPLLPLYLFTVTARFAFLRHSRRLSPSDTITLAHHVSSLLVIGNGKTSATSRARTP